jgi:hypothetical protein
MKKTILLFTLILISLPSICQNKSEENNVSKFKYCELVGSDYGHGKAKIEIDFGQSKEFLTENRYEDPATGKPLVFKSMIDALNFMGKEGWEFAQAYTTGSDGYEHHFLLKKEKLILEKENSSQK